MNPNLNIRFCQRTDIGLVRSENQDSHGKFPPENDDLSKPKGQLFIVADGLGGHQGGQVASQMAINIIQKFYFTNPSEEINTCLQQAFEEANAQIYHYANTHPNLYGMGTTCTALVLKDYNGWIAHVGDSRAYRINRSVIEQLTQDHSQIAEMERQGILTAEEAKDHPQRSLLNRALGVKPSIAVDIIADISLIADDYYLLCSDGLTKVENHELQQVVLSKSPQKACHKLIKLANQKGGEDNVTVQIIQLHSTRPEGKKLLSLLSQFRKK